MLKSRDSQGAEDFTSSEACDDSARVLALWEC